MLKVMKVRFDVVKSNDESLLTEEAFYKRIDRSLKQAHAEKITMPSENKQKEFLGS